MLKRIEEIHEDAIYCIQLSLVRKIYIDETCRMLGKRVYVHKAAPRNKKKEKSGVVYHCHDSYMSWLVSKNAVRNWASFYMKLCLDKTTLGFIAEKNWGVIKMRALENKQER